VKRERREDEMVEKEKGEGKGALGQAGVIS
jgi:hypothetical protein